VEGPNWGRLWKKFILLYTLETPLYPALNKASRDQDRSKILTLGPFARALLCALVTADEVKPLSKEMSLPSLPFVVHRGLSLNQETLDDYKAIVGKPFYLAGNQSTSVSESVAQLFLTQSAHTNTNIPVFQHLTIRNRLNKVLLDTDELTEFTGEKEVLITDGERFILDKIEMKDGVCHMHLTEYC